MKRIVKLAFVLTLVFTILAAAAQAKGFNHKGWRQRNTSCRNT